VIERWMNVGSNYIPRDSITAEGSIWSCNSKSVNRVLFISVAERGSLDHIFPSLVV
jgi:hypothetical protein